ncbi:MAG: RnfABCDGE type electron transport complex subunit D, partial [Clostridia bacterium]
FSGGLLLGAIFMATDYSTSPDTVIGICIYAAGCGLLTAIFRKYGTMPEGVSFAILLMNIITPLLDKYLMPKPFGYVKPIKSKKGAKEVQA